MNRLLFVLLSSAIVIAGYAMYTQNDLGLMQISFAGYYYEASLFEVGVGLLAAIAAGLLLTYGIRRLKRLFGLFAEKRAEQQVQKARHALEHGMIELCEGRHARAEKVLLQKIDHAETPVLNYMAAAHAAHCQGAYERRDEYMRLAHLAAPDADIAIGITQAELHMDHKLFEQALATLNHLNAQSPQHPRILKLLAQVHHRLGDWESLRELLPDLKKSGIMDEAEMQMLEADTWCGLMSDRGNTGDIEVLARLWEIMPQNMKTLPKVVEYYADELLKLDAAGEAEKELRRFLGTNWVESTVQRYAELDVMASDEQISAAEGWLQDHPYDAHLLFALGRMYISKDMRVQARTYLEASLDAKPMPATYLRLAQLLEDQPEDRSQAQEYYRQGLHMLAGDYGQKALAKAENDFQRVIMKPELRVI